jgi:hypothetical protein
MIVASTTRLGCGLDIDHSSIKPSAKETLSSTTDADPSDAVVLMSGCYYEVTWPTVGVYEKPSGASAKLKDKYAGDVVGRHCDCDWLYYNSAEGNCYLAISTPHAENGIGWVRFSALQRL